MQIVIDIPEETYKATCNGDMLPPDVENVVQAIKNAKLLPKGHGKLIDVNELKKVIKENDILTMAGFSVRLCDIDSTPPIIEADNESEVQDDKRGIKSTL